MSWFHLEAAQLDGSDSGSLGKLQARCQLRLGWEWVILVRLIDLAAVREAWFLTGAVSTELLTSWHLVSSKAGDPETVWPRWRSHIFF
jgi:hypothetical protein